MKTLCLVAFLLFANTSTLIQAQAADPSPAQKAAPAVDPELHADVMKLIEVMDIRNKVIAGQKRSMPEAIEKMKAAAPGLSQQFLDEWAKRMTLDSSADAYMNVFIGVYEKHFRADEIQELIQAQLDRNEKKTPVLSGALKEKLSKDGVAIQSEIYGGCAQVGARQGGEIAQQIGKEHPGWVKSAEAGGDKTPAN